MEKQMMTVRKPDKNEIDQARSWSNWSKEISVFNWYYDDTETCLILEGSAEVTDKDENKINFKSGDLVRFEKGLSCQWKITSPLKKKYRFGD